MFRNSDVFSIYQTKLSNAMTKWSKQAVCKSKDISEFYDPEDSALKKAATKYCISCPVQQNCLYTAILTSESHGLWGGLTPRQRRVLVKRLRAIAKSIDLDISIWNKDVENFILEHCSLDTAYDIL
jgi:hypothetical protein